MKGFTATKAERVVPVTEVFDRGRRGEPAMGCDCVQCFGYCMVDHDVARREMTVRAEADNAE